MILGAFCFGAHGRDPGSAEAYFNTNEIITTLMLNYVAGLLLTYLTFGSRSFCATSAPSARARFRRAAAPRRCDVA